MYNTQSLCQNMLGGLPETTDNEATWGVIQGWLSECSSTHDDCNYNPHSREKPTRLIDVELLRNIEPEGDRVLLVESKAGLPTEKYATLSHCWGGEVPALLKSSETCERLSSGWTVKELPKTFREAVITTRKLGIRFLWIDSLCIQQDCDEDWKKESQTMDTVYSNSYLNIAATGARNSSVGLFLERKPKLIQPFEADIRQHGGIGGEDTFSPYLFFRHDLWRTYVNESPLGRRGWVTQERELSPRQIHFTEAGVFWECRCLRDTEFPFEWPQWSENGIHSRKYKSFIQRIDAFEKMDFSISESDRSTKLVHVYNEWDNTIESYSPLKFTRETDRPIAIAGLAKRMQSVVKDTYLAGLWKSRLLYQLLWEIDRERLKPSSHPGRTPQLPVPTWTWLSTRSPIRMFDSPHLHSPWQPRDVRPVAEAVSDESSNVEMDPTGELTGGYIRLRARHWLASRKVEEAFQRGFSIILRIFGAPDHETALGWLDAIPDPQITTQQFIALPIMVDPSDPCVAIGLLLRQIHGEHEKYQRAGVFRMFRFISPQQINKPWADEFLRMTAGTKLDEFKEFVIY